MFVSSIDGPNKSEFRRNDDTNIANKTKIYYAQIQPKIMLEILSARTTTAILILTYVTFMFCLVVDMLNTTYSFNDSNFSFNPPPCFSSSSNTYSSLLISGAPTLSPTITSTDITTIVGADSQNCGLGSSYSWNCSVYNLKNIISAEFTATQTNFSSITNYSSTSQSCEIAQLLFDVTLFACYRAEGCGDTFSSDPLDNGKSTWHRALHLTQQLAAVDLCQARRRDSITITLFPYTFQNQVSPTFGNCPSVILRLIISRFIYVQYIRNRSQATVQ